MTAEIGKPYAESLGEVREIIDTCDFFLGEGRRLYGQTVPSEMPDNAVVWKPADYAAASGEALYRLLVAGGLPEGVLNLVITGGPETFAGLERSLAEGLVDKIGFTGSSAVGA